ncbi:MAG: hypothetical protein QGG14_01460 [Planctomycetota bacterium]|nr:hypothetical protein [Planctomycetota bacterium]
MSDRFYIADDGYNGEFGCVLDRYNDDRAFCSCDVDDVEFVCAALNAADRREKECSL